MKNGIISVASHTEEGTHHGATETRRGLRQAYARRTERSREFGSVPKCWHPGLASGQVRDGPKFTRQCWWRKRIFRMLACKRGAPRGWSDRNSLLAWHAVAQRRWLLPLETVRANLRLAISGVNPVANRSAYRQSRICADLFPSLGVACRAKTAPSLRVSVVSLLVPRESLECRWGVRCRKR